ncbi:conserved tm helix repeat-containing protein [Leptolyngbya sp. Heron Island J]|uniref:mechanosensitive ion channel n=1 Tax=Leptolyngbya sp. Heron Island J TaxID=1385935 RepID=UPI0003B9A44D|nr:mechanosensitive ion channel [Leptolyngbya sp. Heron Island J]ESA36851.1 conserved tm helix repeat-containing protein [Leptolyngbya sp. Heron Island J]
MTQLHGVVGFDWLSLNPTFNLAQTNPITQFTNTISSQLGTFLPGLLGAFLLLIVGLVVATIAKAFAKFLLSKTRLDNQLATKAGLGDDVSVESTVGSVVFWVVMLFFIIAILNALKLDTVSEPISGLLQTVFEYVPRLAGAAVILFVTWVIAKIAKAAVVNGLGRFNLDERLSEQTGVDAEGNVFQVNETLGNVIYWFIFLLSLPLVLSALQLPGLLGPVEELLNEFLSAIPQILTAAIVFGIGWLVANIVKGIVTNLLMATGADNFGARFGLAARPDEGVSVSSLAGVLVYTLILIPAAIAALNELDIDAISGPAVDMLERVLFIIPQVLAAGVVLTVFYFIGQFVSDLVVSLLSGLGFDNVTNVLGLPELSAPEQEASTLPEGEPMPAVEPPQKSPSEIVGVIVLVGIVLFGAITATEILDFPVLTDIVKNIMAVSVRVLSGIVVFAIGLYAANLAFRLIDGMGMSASNTLAQVARIAIIAFVGAMALQQMGVATSIVNLAFGLLLGAIAVAIAIAFGLGGRDVAADNLREWVNHLKQ